MDEKEKKSYLYLRFSIFIFVFFFVLLILVAIILCFILLSPLAPLLLRGFASTTIITIVSVYLASAVLSSFFSYFVGKRILKKFVELSAKSKRVAEGDFSVRIEGKSVIPELENVLNSFNQMVEELGKVDTLSNDFVANVSHEFKAPLAVIRSNVNILENSLLNDDEKSICLSKINQSIDKLSTLVSNVLKISKLDNENVKLEFNSFRLDEEIRTCILTLADKFENKQIELDIDLDAVTVKSDGELLDQVWINILSNAIKFSETGGLIEIKLKVTDVIAVTITDHGEGMSEDTIKHIFDRFFQGETSHSKEGNGLGLTIVGKIIRLLNGSINVKSELGKGTTFIIEFRKDIIQS